MQQFSRHIVLSFTARAPIALTLVLVAAVVAAPHPAHAQSVLAGEVTHGRSGGESPQDKGDTESTSAEAQESEPLPWWQRIRFSGDFRSRYEGFYQEGRPTRNRSRLRLRLRFDSQINEDTRLRIQVASGDPGTPVSTNQTFSSFFRPKPFNLDRAFAAYNPQAALAITLGLGKFGLPQTRTQMIFDDDLNFEGGWQQAEWNLSDTVGVNLIAIQTAVNEVSRGDDTYMMAGYGEINFALGRSTAQLSVANYGWGNADPIAIGSAVGPLSSILTNAVIRDVGGQVTGYASRFNVVDVIGQATLRFGEDNYPVRLLAEYSRNTRAANDRDRGFWTEAEFGSASVVGSFEASYTYGWLQQDVTPSAFVFSDMPGTNVRLHMISTSWMLLPGLSWDLTLHISKRLVVEELQPNNWLFRPHIAAVVRF